MGEGYAAHFGPKEFADLLAVCHSCFTAVA